MVDNKSTFSRVRIHELRQQLKDREAVIQWMFDHLCKQDAIDALLVWPLLRDVLQQDTKEE